MTSSNDTRSLIVPPAIAMLVCALVMLSFNLLVFMFGDSDRTMNGTAQMLEEILRDMGIKRDRVDIDGRTLSAFHNAFLTLVFLSTSVAALGATLMILQRSWWMSLIAALLMFTPFLWLCCCPLPAAIGVWALVILSRRDVRAAFGPIRSRDKFS